MEQAEADERAEDMQQVEGGGGGARGEPESGEQRDVAGWEG